MDEKDTSSLIDLDRRSFTKSLMSLGLTASAAAGLSKGALADMTDNPEEEVPRMGWYEIQNRKEIEKNGDPPEIEPKYYTISRDKWAKIEATKKASEKLARSFTDPNISIGLASHESTGLSVGVSYVIEKDSDGSKSTPNISFTEVQSQVPASMSADVSAGGEKFSRSDIPVTVERVIKEKELKQCGEVPSGCYFDVEYNPVGAGCEGGTGTDSGCGCSLGPTAYSYKYGKYVITTAGHCVNNEGESVYQPTSTGNQLGDVAEIAPSGMDAAVVEPGSDRGVSMGVVDHGGGIRYPIQGMVTEQRITDMMEQGIGVYHTGRRTGDDYGQIDFHANNDQYPWMGYAISTGGGDSGSVTYDILNDSDAYVVALHTGGYCSDGYKYGSGECMYSVEQEMNISYTNSI